MKKLLSQRLPRFDKKIDRLSKLVGQIKQKHSISWGDRLLIERSVLQLQTEWELFVREFILDSATGKFASSQGNVNSVYTVSATLSREKILNKLSVSANSLRHREPNWSITKEAIAASGKLELSNHKHISAVLGASPWYLDDLRPIRNFVAHYSKRSALEVRKSFKLSTRDKICPSQFSLQTVSGGISKFEQWANFIKVTGKGPVH